MVRNMVFGSLLAIACTAAAAFAAGEDKPEAKGPPASEKPKVKWAPAVNPKPLSEHVTRGMKWIANHQLKQGAWGQGEESAQMGGGDKLKDVPSMADTCIATLALVRAGNTPSQGEYAKNVLRATEFVCGEIEESDKDSLYITQNRSTRVQSKLGPYIDTFLAAVLLPELKDRMPDEAGKKRVAAALEKLLAKIQKNQKADGTWGGQGWATTIQQNMAVKGLNRAAQYGAAVDEKTRARAEEQARASFDKSSGKFSAEGSAGVQLYSAGSNYNSVAESVKTNEQQKDKLRELADSKSAPAAQKAEAKVKLDRFQAAEKDLKAAETAIVSQLDDKKFIAGFGSNGGEEFLSYMNIGEGLVVKGGDAWKTWDKSITENLDRIQNQDGSWSGHHCITGRTFCTSAALLVLMVDRSPQPLSESIKAKR